MSPAVWIVRVNYKGHQNTCFMRGFIREHFQKSRRAEFNLVPCQHYNWKYFNLCRKPHSSQLVIFEVVTSRASTLATLHSIWSVKNISSIVFPSPAVKFFFITFLGEFESQYDWCGWLWILQGGGDHVVYGNGFQYPPNDCHQMSAGGRSILHCMTLYVNFATRNGPIKCIVDECKI